MRYIDLLGTVGTNQSRAALQQLLLDTSLNQDLRRSALKRYAVGWAGENGLLQILEEGTLPEEFKEVAASILFNSSSERRRGRAEEFLDPPAGLNGEPLLPIAELMLNEGDAGAGKQLFDQHCSSCHVVQGAGTDFGPDLSEIGAKLPREALYNAILYPDAGIGFGYEGVILTLEDGSGAAGFVLSRTDEEIQLKEQSGQVRSYQLNSVMHIDEMDNSLMPPVARSLSPRQLADLVGYMEKLRSL